MWICLPRPTLIDLEETVINIKKGRHPVISLLFSNGDQFVANDTKLKVGCKFLEFEVFHYLKLRNLVSVLWITCIEIDYKNILCLCKYIVAVKSAHFLLEVVIIIIIYKTIYVRILQSFPFACAIIIIQVQNYYIWFNALWQTLDSGILVYMSLESSKSDWYHN